MGLLSKQIRGACRFSRGSPRLAVGAAKITLRGPRRKCDGPCGGESRRKEAPQALAPGRGAHSGLCTDDACPPGIPTSRRWCGENHATGHPPQVLWPCGGERRRKEAPQALAPGRGAHSGSSADDCPPGIPTSRRWCGGNHSTGPPPQVRRPLRWGEEAQGSAASPGPQAGARIADFAPTTPARLVFQRLAAGAAEIILRGPRRKSCSPCGGERRRKEAPQALAPRPGRA